LARSIFDVFSSVEAFLHLELRHWALAGLKAMEIGAKQYDKEGALFWTSKRKKKQARKNGLPQ